MQERNERATRQRRPVTLTRLIAWVGFTLTTLTILLITMWPNPVDAGMGSTVQVVLDVLYRLGVPASFGYDQLEFTANIVMFLPFGLFLGFLWPHRIVRCAALVLFFTAAIETTQFFFIEGRFGTLLDVLANTLGGWLGLLAVRSIRWGHVRLHRSLR